MTVPATESVQLRCHHCSHWLGESPEPVEFVGMFKRPADRELVEGPRDSKRCGSCKWVNVFQPVARTSRADWRTIQLKRV